MTAEPGFALHPEAARDITEIWEYIAQDNPVAARRVREEILSRIRAVVPFPHSGHKRPDLTGRPLRFLLVREYLIAMPRMKSRCGLSQSCTGGVALA
jgi:plasmid stabilization system protein ParE